MAKQELRENVQELANKILPKIENAIMGDEEMSSAISEAVKIVGFGIKAGHMDEMASYRKASMALRLIPFLPEEVNRDDYVKMMNPELKELKAFQILKKK